MVDETCYDELDLIDIILMLKKYWKMITSLTILTMLIIGSVTAFFIQPKYTSHVETVVLMSRISSIKAKE